MSASLYCEMEIKNCCERCSHWSTCWWIRLATRLIKQRSVCLPQSISLGHLQVLNISKSLRQGEMWNSIWKTIEHAWKSSRTWALNCVEHKSINSHRVQTIGDWLLITPILYTPLVCVGHIPTGFLVTEIQHKMYQIHLRF